MARVWLVLHIAPRCLKTAAMPKMHVFMHFTICRFHRSFFLTEFRTFSGLFFPKRLAVTITKKRKICYKPFDFFLSKFESKKLGGAYQRPQGGGRGGGGRWSGWWRKVVGVVEEGGRGGGGRWSNGGRGQKWKGHLCVLRSKTHIIN